MNSVSFKTNTEIQYSYSVDKKPNTFLNYSDSVIRNEYQLQNIQIRIRFLITPIRFTNSSVWAEQKSILRYGLLARSNPHIHKTSKFNVQAKKLQWLQYCNI